MSFLRNAWCVAASADEVGGEDVWDHKPVILAGDSGAVHARRVLQRPIRDEQGARA